MEKTNLIYGLRDPRNDIYYYIGKTTIGVNRPLSHLNKSHNKNVNNWVLELNNIGLEPYVDILENNIPLENLYDRECFWIDRYSDIDENLFNIKLINRNLSILTDVYLNKIEYVKEILENIGSITKSIRLKYNLTQNELCELCGITISTLSLIETNKNKKVPISTILNILNITKKDLINSESKNKIRIKRNVIFK